MDIDYDELSAKPLADILRSTDDLTRPSSGGKGKRGKIRPEVLDIQRTKDVGITQPVSCSCPYYPRC